MNYTKMLLVPYNKKILEIYEPANNELKEKLIKYSENTKKDKHQINDNLSNQKKLLEYRNKLKTNVVAKDNDILKSLKKKSISNKQKMIKYNQLIKKLKKIKHKPISVDQETQTDSPPIEQNLHNEEPISSNETNLIPLEITSNSEREKINKQDKVKNISNFTKTSELVTEDPLKIPINNNREKINKKDKLKKFSITTQTEEYAPESYDDDLDFAPKKRKLRDFGTFTKKFSNPSVINTRSMTKKWVEF